MKIKGWEKLNGITTDFDSVIIGSIPIPSANHRDVSSLGRAVDF